MNRTIVNGLNGPLVHPLVLIQDLTGGYPYPSAIERFWPYLRPPPVNKTKVRKSYCKYVLDKPLLNVDPTCLARGFWASEAGCY